MQTLRWALGILALGLLAGGLGAFAVGPHAPTDVAMTAFDPAAARKAGWVKLGGGRGDLLRAALEVDGGVVRRIALPLGTPTDQSSARVVVITSSASLGERFATLREPSEELRWVERPFAGRVVDPASVGPGALRLLARLQNEVSPDYVVLFDGEPPSHEPGVLMLLFGALVGLGFFVVSGVQPAKATSAITPPQPTVRPSPPRRPTTTVPAPYELPRGRRFEGPLFPESPPREGEGAEPGFRLTADAEPSAAPPPPASEPAPLEPEFRLAPSALELSPEAPPFDEAPASVEPAPAPVPAPVASPPSAPVPPPAAPVAAVPPDEAEIKRRLIEYSSIATVSADELLRRFRFVSGKVMLLDTALRTLPLAGRPVDVGWETMTTLRVYRCPELPPWSSLMVAEIEVGGGRPIRVVPRTQIDLGGEAADRIQSGLDRLRSFLREVILRAPSLEVDAESRAFVVTGKEPPQLASLRLLAELDARHSG